MSETPGREMVLSALRTAVEIDQVFEEGVAPDAAERLWREHRHELFFALGVATSALTRRGEKPS